MENISTRIFFLFFIFVEFSIGEQEQREDWAVQIPGGKEMAIKIANETQFEFIGSVGNLKDIYHFRKRFTSHINRKKRNIELHTETLIKHNQVKWVKPQESLIRTKRDYFQNNEKENFLKKFQRASNRNRVVRMFNDPKWAHEWYLYDFRELKTSDKSDMRVVPVWKMNITGRGVKVTIIDDGIEHTHPDLQENYDPLSSTDLNDDDNDPMPNTAPGTTNEHGTRCASEVAMIANNEICGVGIAFNSKIGGIRLLDGPVNDLLEAKSLGFNNQHIDIYSASWGPLDDGKTMAKPGTLTEVALERGATLGRKGKGNIYVWASGNGGYYEDSCSCDGYASSIYVINVSSITPNNEYPDFSEECPSAMCVTYSTSGELKSKLVTADIHGKCTDQMSGTSASAPFAAGIFALVLEANTNLTWRDIKHLITWTSQYHPLKYVKGWKQNSRGFLVNEKFGFGLLDAYHMVTEAKSWKQVPNLRKCIINKKIKEEISNTVSKAIVINASKCKNKILFIENIIIEATISYSKRGALRITLQSPHGMNTTLLPPRSLDDDEEGLNQWPLNTAHNWGESPEGNWIVYVEDKRKEIENRKGIISNITMIFWGTKELPNHIRNSVNGRRIYKA